MNKFEQQYRQWGAIALLSMVIMLLLIGSLSYSKAFKIKTRILEIVEINKGFNSDVEDEIDSFLKSAGYPVNTRNNKSCPTVKGIGAINTINNFDYCIYSFETLRGPYYRVTVFISYDIPVISDFLRIPVSGETRIIYDFNN
jgi:hypothetical protein